MKAKFVLAAAACATLLAGAPALADQHEHGKMDHSLHGPLHHGLMMAAQHESRAEDKARDQYRHPVETLAFFQVAPDMKVGELAPGGGWYTRMLASYLSEKGELVGLYRHPSFATSDPERQAQMRADAAAFPEKVSGWSGMSADRIKGFTTDALPEEELGTYDRIIVVRIFHHLFRTNSALAEIKAMRSLLKDDGMIGIVQHRAKMDAPYAYADGTKGYVREADVIAMMEANGFEFMGRSEINANPADSADHPRGVWELPPVWGGKSEELKKVGESDRMTLLF
ncbi:MAG: class I SAM-dependent methyltransferase, partial [Sphingomonadaceae bacterium]|nr:class I SAM-dependent methyltransferase [Sphingomonadaceae bacterium]